MSKISLTPDKMFKNIYVITPALLKENGITTVIFDVDNTIVPYNSQEIPEQAIPWFNTMKEKGFYLCIQQSNQHLH